MKNKWKWIIGIIVILFVGYYGYGYFFKKADKPSFRTVKIERGSITATVAATGGLQATVQVDVGSQVSGIIQKINVDYNSKVKKGEVIAQIDPRTFQAQVDQDKASLQAARAELANAVASVEQAKADIANTAAAVLTAKANAAKARSQLANDSTNYVRYQQLRQQDLVSQSDLDNSRTTFETSRASYEATLAQVTSSQAQLESSEASEKVTETKIDTAKSDITKAQSTLEQAQLNLDYTTIIAPVNGIVINNNIQEGQTVAASFQTPTLFTIAENLEEMQVIASIDEADVGNVKEGNKATFTVDAYPDKKFEGVVDQIRYDPITSQNVVTYQGVIDVKNPNYELRPGMTANIIFSTAHEDNILKVPNAALRFKLETTSSTDTSTTSRGGFGGGGQRQGGGQGGGGQSSGGRGPKPKNGKIYVLDDKGTPQPIEVKIDISDGNLTAVESDKLKEGQEVIIGYQTPGAAVTSSPLAAPFRGR